MEFDYVRSPELSLRCLCPLPLRLTGITGHSPILQRIRVKPRRPMFVSPFHTWQLCVESTFMSSQSPPRQDISLSTTLAYLQGFQSRLMEISPVGAWSSVNDIELPLKIYGGNGVAQIFRFLSAVCGQRLMQAHVVRPFHAWRGRQHNS